MKLHVIVFLSLGFLVSCDAGIYESNENRNFCFKSSNTIKVLDKKISSDYEELLLELRGNPVVVSENNSNNHDLAFSMLISVNSKSRLLPEAAYFKDLLSRVSAIPAGLNSLESYNGYYRLKRNSNSAISSFDYFKINPIANLSTLNSDNASHWYLGLCIEGIGAKDTCTIAYKYKDYFIEYEILESALKYFNKVSQYVEDNLNEALCKK